MTDDDWKDDFEWTFTLCFINVLRILFSDDKLEKYGKSKQGSKTFT